MSYLELAYIHLVTVVPAFLIGTYLIFTKKGTPSHKRLGRVYMILMLFSATTSLFMEAQVGSLVLGHFGFIHLLSFLTIYAVPVAYFSAKNGNIKRHKMSMVALYVGGMLVAGTFALMPGRLLHDWLFV
ncbi:DUF2306 domain-containing protein [Ferrimonas aestuarii]|uniref:DUF2306 domain-containing protein n=1 Tax=Ferrimonas aestuarii TaxID=2569539 RepID=A0A4U1BK16_9GAMM|nr:DUF2306 domain-containing protein [Ferrimonas aestuarii]TKB51950.1 DUF2306 domain-containing protein [Ferrimonas aestuarii]